MNNHLEYKGYIGSAEVDLENDIVHGRLLFIRDAIGYHASTPKELVDAFHEAVDDYLAVCQEKGVAPDVPCKGSFNVRVGPERHRKLAIFARTLSTGLNEVVISALDAYLEPHRAKTVVHNHQWVMVGHSQQVATGFTAEPKMVFGLAGSESSERASH